MSTQSEQMVESVFTFAADIVRYGVGHEPVAVALAEDERSSVVICENGNAYRVTLNVLVDELDDAPQEEN